MLRLVSTRKAHSSHFVQGLIVFYLRLIVVLDIFSHDFVIVFLIKKICFVFSRGKEISFINHVNVFWSQAYRPNIAVTNK